jgi:hypothetical protein
MGVLGLLPSLFLILLVWANLALAGVIDQGVGGGRTAATHCVVKDACAFNLVTDDPQFVFMAPSANKDRSFRNGDYGEESIAPAAWEYTPDMGIRYRVHVDFRPNGVTFLGSNWYLQACPPNNGGCVNYRVGDVQTHDFDNWNAGDALTLRLRYGGTSIISNGGASTIRSRISVRWQVVDDVAPWFKLTAGDAEIPIGGSIDLGTNADEGAGRTTISISPSDNTDVTGSSLNGQQFPGDAGGSISIPNGEYTITGSATDRAGNVTNQSSHVRFDSGAPTVRLLQTPIYETASPIIPVDVSDEKINGYSSKVRDVQFYLDDGTGNLVQRDATAKCSGSACTVQPSALPEGIYAFSVSAHDNVGNLGKSSEDNPAPLVIDWTAPAISSITPGGGAHFQDPPTAVVAKVDDATGLKPEESKMELDGLEVPVVIAKASEEDPSAAPTTYNMTYSPQTDTGSLAICPGTHTVNILAVDRADHATVGGQQYTLDGRSSDGSTSEQQLAPSWPQPSFARRKTAASPLAALKAHSSHRTAHKRSGGSPNGGPPFHL